MKIALAQLDIAWEDKILNKEKCEAFIRLAAKDKADIILFPEMTLSGFTMNVEAIGEEDHNQSVSWFSNQAINSNISIGFGYIEKTNTSKANNNYAIINNYGDILDIYSKIHPFSFGEESIYFKGGNSITLCEIGDWIISPFICYDLRFPEIFQAASKTSNLITVAANWPEARISHWESLLKARAIENQCYVAGVNRTGFGDNIKYCGKSMVVAPDGNVIACGDCSEGLITAELDISKVKTLRESFRLKDDRREDLYISLYNKYKNKG